MELMKFIEHEPENYPLFIHEVGKRGWPQNHEALWRRLEAYVDMRWFPRKCEWVICGSGDYAIMSPASDIVVKVWREEAWQDMVTKLTPWDTIAFPYEGTYQITATIGADVAIPQPVVEAFRRLKKYTAQSYLPNISGASSYSKKRAETDWGGVNEVDSSIPVAGDEISYTRNPAWMARALVNSGAADLLRPYRKAR